VASDTFFIAKSDVSDVELIQVGGVAVVEKHEIIREALVRLCGPDTADLLAEPVYRRGNGEAPAVISWYATLPDDARRLSSLDAEDAKAVETRLHRKLADIAEAMRDPQVGPLLGAVLHLRSADEIYALGDRPVIVNWGMVPSSVGLSPKARNQHFMDTLGRHLAWTQAPPITVEEHRTLFGAGDAEGGESDDGSEKKPSAAPAAMAATAASAGALGTADTASAATGPEEELAAAQTFAATGGEPPSSPPPSGAPPSGSPPSGSPPSGPSGSDGPSSGGDDPSGRGRPAGFGWRWIPLIVLLALTGLALLWFSIPGVLLYPPDPVLNDEEVARIADETNESLRRRRDELRRALDGAVCRADGELRFPPVAVPGGGGSAAAGSGGSGAVDDPDGGNGDRSVGSDEILPPPPERVQVPADEGAPTDLLTYIEQRTAMVIVGFAGGTGSGTGFFVAPDLLVTNDHVIHGSLKDQQQLGPPQSISVKSDALGGGRPAELVMASGQTRGGVGPDFALVRVPGADAKYFPVWGSTDSIKLQHVIAAGFPGAYFKIDQARAKMYDPNDPTMPDMIMTRGEINAQQNVGPRGTLSVVHSADISSGNSGGPLVDQCGRVVGVNTFGILDENTKRYLNFSLHTSELLQFLNRQGTEVASVSEACTPQVASRQAPPREEQPQPPEAEAPESGQGPAQPAAPKE